MWRHVVYQKHTDVSEEHAAFVFRMWDSWWACLGPEWTCRVTLQPVNPVLTHILHHSTCLRNSVFVYHALWQQTSYTISWSSSQPTSWRKLQDLQRDQLALCGKHCPLAALSLLLWTTSDKYDWKLSTLALLNMSHLSCARNESSDKMVSSQSRLKQRVPDILRAPSHAKLIIFPRSQCHVHDVDESRARK